jgi:UDP-N-acetylglucosamine--N-acetylmuramyl-(pentapeptide) pyrophosphoryl-undecaprenol N-acetylglucosamine transferase
LVKILYGVSSIGFGHAARSAAVGLKLRERGLEPVFATGGNVVQFLESYGFKVHDIVREPTPWERNGEMRYPALWYMRYWFGYRSTKRMMGSLVDELRPDVIAGDEEFSCISTAIERQIRHAMISDELELGFAKGRFSRYVEKKVGAWYADLQHRTSGLLVPDFGVDYENVHFVSPVVRTVTRNREQVMATLGLGPGAQIILYSASGSGIGGFIFDHLIRAIEMLSPPGVVLVVTGLSGGPARPWVRYLGVQRDNQDFVASADLVVSTAGKSTIDEAASYGSPLIAIPIKNHSEQERNAAALGFSSEDLYHLDQLVPRYLGRRTEPMHYHGADSIAAYLQGLH